MADYVPPTSTDVIARFPEFAPVSATLIGLVLQEAGARIGDTWLQGDRSPATLYLAAHLLASEGEPGRTISGTTSTDAPIKMEKAGDHQIEYAIAAPGSSGSAASDGDFGSTVYGRRYLKLLRLNFPAVLTV